MIFIQYPKCSTCKKALKFLNDNNILYIDRNIVDNPPTAYELKDWINKYNIPIKKMFNTSGIKYRQMNLKEKLPSMTEDQQYELLSSDGMLIKRPLLVGDDFILIGFKEEEWLKLKER